MRRATRSKDERPPGAFLLAPGRGFRHYRLVVLIVAVVLVVSVVLAIHGLGATAHPLAPVGAVIVTISAVAAALAGVWVGLAAALAGVLASFLLLADFGTGRGTANALVSAAFWCGASGRAPGSSGATSPAGDPPRDRAGGGTWPLIAARDTLERVLDLSPQFLKARP